MAGRNATKQLSKHTKKQQELNEKEAWLTAREMGLNCKSAVVRAPEAVEGIIRGVYEVGLIVYPDTPCLQIADAVQVIADAKAVLHEALVTLNQRNEAIAGDDEDIRCGASTVVEATAVDIAGIFERLTALEGQSEHQLGRPARLSESVRRDVDTGQS